MYKYELDTDNLTNIQRAARFFYLIAYSYGSKCSEYCCRSKGVIRPVEYLKQVQKRLDMTVIENKSYDKLIRLYDRTEALFYLDPPYFNAEKFYKDYKFTMQDHNNLCSILKTIKGKFILSYNNCDAAKEMYRDFAIVERERQNNLCNRYNGHQPYKELLIMNF